MKDAELIVRLAAGSAPLRDLCRDLAPEQVCWKPAPRKWSILDVICHLVDEERDDFRTRLDLTLHQPEASWPPIDPEGWVTSHNYAGRELDPMLAEFLRERERSVAWLRGLANPDWDRAHQHPHFGPIRAGDLLLSWVVHDLLHIRQVTRMQFEYTLSLGEPYSERYAGAWEF